MTEQNVCLVELNTLITRSFDLAKYNLSFMRKSPKVKKSKSHNRNRALVRQLILNSFEKMCQPNYMSLVALIVTTLTGKPCRDQLIRLAWRLRRSFALCNTISTYFHSILC